MTTEEFVTWLEEHNHEDVTILDGGDITATWKGRARRFELVAAEGERGEYWKRVAP